MKRKADDVESSPPPAKKQAVGEDKKKKSGIQHDPFRANLFDDGAHDDQKKQYETSKPYRHGVIPDLISHSLLRSVRSEIQDDLSFTPKETDIYKIHQSGDLANLDGLDDSSLKLLPSLLALRNALYSPQFRSYLSDVTKSGPLSGKKTDMAINVYTPGCHLLCHDDVIGSRRVSYILYLTDPDKPWKPEWGGALRLYPTESLTDKGGQPLKVPSPDWSVSIPPAFGQLSFFAVQPGESFHDVEEVYAAEGAESTDGDASPVRMAISGWYHIPQKGEEGYVEGLEEKLAEKSSLMQLQTTGDAHDLPKAAIELYEAPTLSAESIGLPTPSSQEDTTLSEEELDFLLKFIAPTYLTPDTLESVASMFAEESSLLLDTFLSSKFSDSLRKYVQSEETQTLPGTSTEIEKDSPWHVARPPHKHRFLFQRTSETTSSPIQEILSELFPSKAFRKWLQLATGHVVKSHDGLARRFRRGQDYTLAQGYADENPRLELCFAITPSPGWDGEEAQPTEADQGKGKGKGKEPAKTKEKEDEEPGVGGYLMYMAGDEDAEEGGDEGVEVPLDTSTGARATKSSKQPKSDPAIYQAHADDDDGVLFSMQAGWNRLAIVLRDRGTMRFVKYVSRQAKGDRWDVVGEFELDERQWEDEDEDEEEEDEDEGEKRPVGKNVSEETTEREVQPTSEEEDDKSSSDEDDDDDD